MLRSGWVLPLSLALLAAGLLTLAAATILDA